MRYLFALLLFIFLIVFCWYMQPLGLWAAQDDSGLKMFELKASDMLGLVYDPLVKHNSNTMSDMQNMFKTENGFANIPLTAYTGGGSVVGKQQIYNLISVPSSSVLSDNTYLCTSKIGATNKTIWDKFGNAQYTGAGATIETTIINAAFRFFYSGAVNTFLSTIDGFYYKTDAATYWTRKTLPGSTNAFSTCDIYKNRIFGYDPTDNNIWYSAATDLLDFTVSADSGGVILIPSVEKIEWIKAIRGGLAIFAYDGIYMLSGDQPLNFSIEKISNLRIFRYWSMPLTHFSESGDIYFAASTSSRTDIAIYVMDGSGNVQKIVDAPAISICTSMSIWYGRFVVATNSIYSYVYDLKFKCWYIWYGIDAVYKDSYVTRYPLNGQTPSDYLVNSIPNYSDFGNTNDWSRAELFIKSQYFNLDSNANVNIIRRIEIDAVVPGNIPYTFQRLTNKDTNGRYLNYITTTIINTAELTIYTPQQTSVFTLDASDMLTTVTPGSEENITTFYINTPSIRTTNKVKFQLKTYYKMAWQSIRIYYEPKGNYKRKELY